MIVLGVDISTKTGWVAREMAGEDIHTLGFGEIIAPKKFKGFDRVSYIGGKFAGITTRYQPDLIMIEGYGFANAFTLVTLVEIGTAIKLHAYKNYPVLEVPPMSLKKFATSAGNAKKDKMMLEIYKRWGFTGTDNEADAFALAQFGFALLGAIKGIPATNMDAVHSWTQSDKDGSKRKTLEGVKYLQLTAKTT